MKKIEPRTAEAFAVVGDDGCFEMSRPYFMDEHEHSGPMMPELWDDGRKARFRAGLYREVGMPCHVVKVKITVEVISGELFNVGE